MSQDQYEQSPNSFQNPPPPIHTAQQYQNWKPWAVLQSIIQSATSWLPFPHQNAPTSNIMQPLPCQTPPNISPLLQGAHKEQYESHTQMHQIAQDDSLGRSAKSRKRTVNSASSKASQGQKRNITPKQKDELNRFKQRTFFRKCRPVLKHNISMYMKAKTDQSLMHELPKRFQYKLSSQLATLSLEDSNVSLQELILLPPQQLETLLTTPSLQEPIILSAQENFPLYATTIPVIDNPMYPHYCGHCGKGTETHTGTPQVHLNTPQNSSRDLAAKNSEGSYPNQETYPFISTSAFQQLLPAPSQHQANMTSSPSLPSKTHSHTPNHGSSPLVTPLISATTASPLSSPSVLNSMVVSPSQSSTLFPPAASSSSSLPSASFPSSPSSSFSPSSPSFTPAPIDASSTHSPSSQNITDTPLESFSTLLDNSLPSMNRERAPKWMLKQLTPFFQKKTNPPKSVSPPKTDLLTSHFEHIYVDDPLDAIGVVQDVTPKQGKSASTTEDEDIEQIIAEFTFPDHEVTITNNNQVGAILYVTLEQNKELDDKLAFMVQIEACVMFNRANNTACFLFPSLASHSDTIEFTLNASETRKYAGIQITAPENKVFSLSFFYCLVVRFCKALNISLHDLIMCNKNGIVLQCTGLFCGQLMVKLEKGTQSIMVLILALNPTVDFASHTIQQLIQMKFKQYNGYLQHKLCPLCLESNLQISLKDTENLCLEHILSHHTPTPHQELANKCKSHQADKHHIYLSYRADTEGGKALFTSMEGAGGLVELVYWRLASQKLYGSDLRVFWDKMCLNDGCDWEDGFLHGITSSSVIILLMSNKAMEAVCSNAAISQDNMLLEFECALLLKIKMDKPVIPVFVGDKGQNGKFVAFRFPTLPNTPHARTPHANKIITKLSDSLPAKKIEFLTSIDWTIREICKLQGISLAKRGKDQEWHDLARRVLDVLHRDTKPQSTQNIL
eukprot:Phypoly_transcript_01584.p1 GENE.Phypoly_transcript_01584~~Phypoly_transcript_01584.p1  ORF type:complete len:957 (+),score=134.40 Phypoly_transcript_01584:242-3112(+)